MSGSARREPHNRAEYGEYLTREEREALEVVYAESGQAAPGTLREAAASAGSHSVRPAGLSDADWRVAATLKRHLAEMGPPLDFRVFGSRVLGSATWEADLDIFIELETASEGTRQRIEELVWEIGFAAGLVISPFVVTPTN
jgi:Nucleotidyltransferase domain